MKREFNKSNLIISIIGSMPPPYGGVSTHIQRFREKLKKLDINISLYDLTNKKILLYNGDCYKIFNRYLWFAMYFFGANEQIIHFHYSDWKARVVFSFMGNFGKKIIITIHGESFIFSIKNANWLKKKIIKLSLQNTAHIIAVNDKIYRSLIEFGIETRKISIVPAFIPPSNQTKDYLEIPEEIWTFMSNHYPILSANAYNLSFHEGKDLYGIDLCIELCNNLRYKFPNIGFIVCIALIDDMHYFNQLMEHVNKLGLERNFVFIAQRLNFYPILMKCNVFIRPTNTDGDALSIREALYYGIPVIASDVIDRPNGSIIFFNRNINDLTQKTMDLLENYAKYKTENIPFKNEDNFLKIMEIYNTVLMNEKFLQDKFYFRENT